MGLAACSDVAKTNIRSVKLNKNDITPVEVWTYRLYQVNIIYFLPLLNVIINYNAVKCTFTMY